jgi:hypothetical protein
MQASNTHSDPVGIVPSQAFGTYFRIRLAAANASLCRLSTIGLSEQNTPNSTKSLRFRPSNMRRISKTNTMG